MGGPPSSPVGAGSARGQSALEPLIPRTRHLLGPPGAMVGRAPPSFGGSPSASAPTRSGIAWGQVSVAR
eukprot:12410350-Karenia_brevis.AAC.1